MRSSSFLARCVVPIDLPLSIISRADLITPPFVLAIIRSGFSIDPESTTEPAPPRPTILFESIPRSDRTLLPTDAISGPNLNTSVNGRTYGSFSDIESSSLTAPRNPYMAWFGSPT